MFCMGDFSSSLRMESWLRFANLQLPARLGNALLAQFGDPDALFSASPADLESVPGMTANQIARIADPSFLPTQAQLRFMELRQVRLITCQDPGYPRNLRDIADPPAALFVRGSLEERDRFSVALVGTRQASPYGRSVTEKLARDLADAGLTVVSGGALGIDSAAHRATVNAGGRTLVVLGCGLDVPYPRENQTLFQQIADEGHGAVLSEFPLGATPEPWRFPLRNRIISGLAMGVVVIEAGAQSGALLTASIAAEQGREVMAIPGNVDRPHSRGSNGLIKDGAALVEEASDVLRVLNVLSLEAPRPSQTSAPPRLHHDLPELQRRMLENLSLVPKHLDALAADVQVPLVEVSVQMTMLELSGLVRRLPGNCYIRVL
jgi:DNA processing protein